MTREEAIKLLENISIAYTPTDEYGEYDDPQPYEEAIDMAIEALSADTVSREEYEEVKEEYINTVGAILAVISAPSCLKEVNDLIEPLKVVRCKDCRFWKNEHLCLVMSRYGSIDTKAEHYCSWGERREK